MTIWVNSVPWKMMVFFLNETFDDKAAAQKAIKEFSIRNHVDYFVYESNMKTFYAKCLKHNEGCDWKIRVSKLLQSEK